MSYNTPIPHFEERRLLHIVSRLPAFEEALARLLYIIEHRRPCGLVLGRAGTGKSALFKLLARELSRTACRPLLIDLLSGDPTSLAWGLAAGMGLSPGATSRPESLWRTITDRARGAAMSGQPFVPIIDHLAQTDPDAVAGLSRCCQLAVQHGGTVLLSARPPLSSALAEVVGPLCDLRIELPVWTAEETAAFVSQVAESSGLPRLTEDAVAALHACTGGIMREVVQVLRLAIYAACAQGLDTVDAELLQSVAEEIWQPASQMRPSLTALPRTVELAATHRRA